MDGTAHMERCTRSVNPDLDLHRQSRVPAHECMSRPARCHFCITLQKIIDWPMSLEGLASSVVEQ
jgi:hypothetical protein